LKNDRIQELEMTLRLSEMLHAMLVVILVVILGVPNQAGYLTKLTLLKSD
jgi:hypothetical protein